jgi:hypothetical protein
MKITIKGYIVQINYPWEKSPKYRLSSSGNVEYLSEYEALVMEHIFDVEVPDNFDPRPGQIAALKAQREKAQADFSKRVMEIDAKINELLAIEA